MCNRLPALFLRPLLIVVLIGLTIGALLILPAQPGRAAQATATLAPIPTIPIATRPPAAPTRDPYQGLRIAELLGRSYGGGALTIRQTMSSTARFTRYLVSYPSDGLTIYGFMNVPNAPPGSGAGQARYPVIIALHGYIEPRQYTTLDYTTRYADRLAEAGYLVIHPNLRNYPPSDNGPNLFRVGFAVDVLNLIAIVRAQGGQPGSLAAADASRIGLWGHSMGGGISIRVLVVSADIRASVLYGAMSGDEARNYAQIRIISGGTRGRAELTVPADELQLISAGNFLDRVTAAVSIHHGTADNQVPPAWSSELCASLRALGKSAECFSYAGQPHTFVGQGDALFIERMVAFYDRALR